MAEPAHDPRPSTPPGGTLSYRSPGRQPKSQWLTDDQAYGACLVYALLVLSVLGAILGIVGWLVWTALGWL